MSEERLEEIKGLVYKVVIHLNSSGLIEPKDVNNLYWLIEQAELLQHFAKKNAELNEFLQKHNEPKHLGRNVIDVAMDIITEQAERVQELESMCNASTYIQRMLRKQNKRYRKQLENALYFVKHSRYEPDKARIMQESIEKVLEGEK